MIESCQFSYKAMAHLFKDKIIRAELEQYSIPDFENKISRVKTWYEAYKNKSLHAKTESQCEQAFNQHFFVEILGYTTFPDENYTIDPKGTADASAQKADAVLGDFSTDTCKVTAVVEIKDVNTSLDRSQRREGNMSPVQQAFKYKPQYIDCAFVIATNFFEIRLFRDNQLDYESFTLEDLVDSKDNFYNFRKFYYLLNADNFVIKHGKSNTEKLLSEIRIEQEKITKEFYRDYKDLRQNLINNLAKNNPNIYFNKIIEKAQKIIDRVVFICFCEDKDLLPENKLQEVVFHTEKLGLTIPVWDILKGFFKAIDSGSPKLGIPDGYNGELFKEDVELNNMIVSDAICKSFVDLGKYDFSEDLSVNILGHIFEQSISDLEELKSFLEQKEIDKKKSKRKKDGIFYTPDYIVDYIVKNSLGTYLDEKEKEILRKHDLKEDINDKHYEKRAVKAYQEYQDFIRNIKILDPACGSGAFLVKVFDYLFAENKRVADILADLAGGTKDLFSSENYIKNLLENNIYGVDLNPESVEISKLSLWLKTAIKGKKLVSLKGNIKCGNSLIEDPAVSNVAFKWEAEFPEIMKDGGFDVIVGNPPYVFGGNKGVNTIEKDYFSNNYLSGKGKINLFELFTEKAINILKSKGKLSFIIPNTFLRVTSYAGSRKFLLENSKLESIINLPSNIFQDAVTSSIIFVAQKQFPSPNHKIKIIQKEEVDEKQNSVRQSSFKAPNYIISLSSSNELNESIIRKTSDGTIDLGSICKELIFGVVISGNKDEVVFDKYAENLKPFLEGKDIGRYFTNPINKWLKYDPHLLHRPRTKEIFEVPEKLLIQRITGGSRPLSATYDDNQIYNKESINNLILKENSGYNIKFILALINSSLINYFYSQQFTNDSKLTVNISKTYLSLIPVKKTDKDKQNLIAKIVDKIINLNQKINSEIQNIKTIICEDLRITKCPNAINEFWCMDFTSFISALSKSVIIPILKKNEILPFFQQYKNKTENLERERKSLEKELDDIIFELYQLTDEEKQMITRHQETKPTITAVTATST